MYNKYFSHMVLPFWRASICSKSKRVFRKSALLYDSVTSVRQELVRNERAVKVSLTDNIQE